MAEVAKTTKKASGKPKSPKSNIQIGEMIKISKEMPTNIGKGAKYSFLGSMRVGECVCLPPGSFNVSPDILKRAIQGASRRFNVKVICSTEPEGFCIWRKE